MWKNVSQLLGTNVTWKHIVIGMEEMNHNAQIINVCVSIIAFSIFSIWIKCSLSDIKYEKVQIQNCIQSRLVYYGKVLEKTKTYSVIGKKCLNIFG